MAAFETLLNRFCEQPGLVDDSQLLDAIERREEVALAKAWRHWIHAQKATRQGDPRLALRWLYAGDHVEEVRDDLILRAELASAVAQCWLWLGEPREAVGPATVAWDTWAAVADHPRVETIAPSARVLLEVLSEPHSPPDLSDDEVLLAWMEDRMALSVIGAANQAMQVYAEFHDLPAAEQVSKTFLDWVARTVGRGPMKAYSGLLEARMLKSLGEVFDRCGNSEQALAVFDDGLSRLEELPQGPEIRYLTGGLLFNGANQLGKLERNKEALDRYEESEELLKEAGDHEAVLRCSYAACIVRFKLGELAGLEDELAALAIEYERHVEEAEEGSILIAARQMLDRVYRLWLRIEADQLDVQDPMQVLMLLHHVFALKEEEGKFTGIWRQMRGQEDRTLISEVSVLIERAEQHVGLGILVIEQVIDALLFVAIRPGSEPWLQRFALQVVHDPTEIDAITDLVLEHREAVDRLGDRSLPVRSEPSDRFVAACQRASKRVKQCLLRAGIRRFGDLLRVDFERDLRQPSRKGRRFHCIGGCHHAFSWMDSGIMPLFRICAK